MEFQTVDEILNPRIIYPKGIEKPVRRRAGLDLTGQQFVDGGVGKAEFAGAESFVKIPFETENRAQRFFGGYSKQLDYIENVSNHCIFVQRGHGFNLKSFLIVCYRCGPIDDPNNSTDA